MRHETRLRDRRAVADPGRTSSTRRSLLHDWPLLSCQYRPLREVRISRGSTVVPSSLALFEGLFPSAR